MRKITSAMAFIVLLGIASLFSDMTHEGAASIRGAYLAILGASAGTIGFISGLGELVGYSLRLWFGKLTDRTRKYWAFTIVGYCIDVFAVPLLALVGEHGWVAACALLILERTGKAVKKPAKNTILSFAASQGGVGKGFAIQEALDQIGAVLGPVLLYVVMLFRSDAEVYRAYARCFAVLAVPAFATVLVLLYARKKFPNPERFEPETPNPGPFRLTPSFMIYLAAIGCFAFGFIDFSLITMHALKTAILSPQALPLLYAGAMLVDAVAALWFGWLFDRHGFKVLMVSTALAAGFVPCIFGFRSLGLTWVGSILWGIGMGAQESILKAAVAGMVPKANRASGYGVFECAFGVCWFLGSWLTGVLYDISLPLMIGVSMAAQLAAIPLFGLSAARSKRK